MKNTKKSNKANSSKKEVILQNEDLRAVIAPEYGAGMLAFFVQKEGRWLPVMPDAREASCDLEWANFLMIPYSNRIEQGRFTFDGQDVQLANGEKHAIHGDVRTRPWCAEDKSKTYIRCDFQSNAHENVNWPWAFEARAEYEIMENVFSMRLSLWNRSDKRMPAGFGWHPYFSRFLTRPGEDVYMQMQYEGVYPDANDNRIPSGPAEPPVELLDFSREKDIPESEFFDACAYGYDGKGYITWPDSGVRVEFACTSGLTHLVLYNPTDKPYFAVEPVTNANNGVNLFAQEDPTSGIVVLEPGESLEERFDLYVDAL